MSLEVELQKCTSAISDLSHLVALLTDKIGAMQAPGPTETKKPDAATAKDPAVSAVPTKKETAALSELPNADPQSSLDTTSGEQSQPTGESSSPANDDEAKAQIDAERSAAPELDYAKDVKPITLRLSKEKGREITIGVLSRFGVKSAQDLDPARWEEYIAHCGKVLVGGEV